ncbi:VMAP-C domain-containing protein [Streptomyces sp. NPDC054813]
MDELKRTSDPALLLGLTEVLCELSCMQDPQGRLMFADVLGEQLGAPVDLRGVRLREDAVALTRAVLRVRGGESVLIAVVRILEGMPAADEVERLLVSGGVSGLAQSLPGPLSQQDVSTARLLLDQAADTLPGPAVRDGIADELGIHLPVGLTPPQLFSHVLELNTQPDGLPPAVLVMEHAAASVQVPSRRRALSAWAEEWARRAGLLPELERRRADRLRNRPDPSIPPCLVVMVEPARDGTGEIVVRPWLSSVPGRWHPLPAEPRTTTLDGLGAAVEQSLRQLARLLSASGGDTSGAVHPPPFIEFVLPHDLLNHDVAGLTYQVGEGQPLPLTLRYGVHLRSLERMRSNDPLLRRQWQERWRALHRQGVLAWEWRQSSAGGVDRSHAVLAAEPNFTAAVLDAPDGGASSSVLKAVIAAGIGLAVWDRRGAFHADRRSVMSAVFASVASAEQLPHAIQRLRRSAELREEGPLLLGRHIAFLWDDPTRLVDQAEPWENGPDTDTFGSEESWT